ncbi:MAG TPA: GntR family transcriptional regulator [Alphaproteobacteria bacterium]|nr:GntR family transcriptional regulator [Alphaproteobacteria bacterium]
MAQHNNLDTLVREGLRSKILNGDLEGGYHLSELKISKDYSVSRTPVREALCALAADGLVEMVPHRGAFVTHVPSQSKTDQLRAYGLFTGLAAKLAAENANIEMLLDLENAFSFAQDGAPSSDQYLAQLEAALDMMEKTANSPSVSDAIAMIKRRSNLTELWAMSLGQRKELNNQFGLLMAALKRKKPDAAEKTMRQIVTLATNAYLAGSRKSASAADSVTTDMNASLTKKGTDTTARA